MRKAIFYNDIDPFACEWLRWLIKAGEIPDGDVDSRSICDITADEVRGYTQCHWFAGISGWSVALGLSGWSPTERVWTGSCPCPPFSAAGTKKACPRCSGIRPIPCPRRTGVFICIDCEHAWYADGRHLFPEFHRLISQCRPPVVYLEQVSGGDGLVWLAGVRARLERSGYAVGAADLPAACVGSPNIRQRVWGCAVRVADASDANGRAGVCGEEEGIGEEEQRRRRLAGGGASGWLADTDGGISGDGGLRRGGKQRLLAQGDGSGPERLVDSDSSRRGEQRGAEPVRPEQPSAQRAGDAGPWADFDLVYCGDNAWRRIPRRIEPGIQRLADGIPVDLDLLRTACLTFPRSPKVKGRVGVLRGFGNAINPYVAAKFIRLTRRWISGERR